MDTDVEAADTTPPADGEEPPTAEPKAESSPHSGGRKALEWAAVLLGAVVLAFVVKTFLLQAFWIPSGSMEKTLVKDDRVLVNKVSYDLHDVHRGDVIVFKRPPLLDNPTIKDLIKRVIALPGERLSIHDGHVFINGRQLNEPYTKGVPTYYNPCGAGEVAGIDKPAGVVVPAHTVMVMGDNRSPNGSDDSRCWGPLAQNLIVGRAFAIIWPPWHAGRL